MPIFSRLSELPTPTPTSYNPVISNNLPIISIVKLVILIALFNIRKASFLAAVFPPLQQRISKWHIP